METGSAGNAFLATTNIRSVMASPCNRKRNTIGRSLRLYITIVIPHLKGISVWRILHNYRLGQNPCPCAFARWQNPCPCAFTRCNIDGGDTIAQVAMRGHHRRRNVTSAEKLSRYWSRVHSWDMNVPFMN